MAAFTQFPLFLSFLILITFPVTTTLDCFKCVSIDGDNPECEDPFHNNFSISILEAPCMGGRKGRNGVFPASACIKLKGVYGDTGHRMVVRGCALDSGTLTVDTELVRMSHCGGFYFNERYVSGCVQSCHEEACNGCDRFITTSSLSIILVMFLCGVVLNEVSLLGCGRVMFV